ncbi:MAG TPA: response regulator [Candidatus Latescibacteria bacterium]|nr:response regulator [Candidatus Latescibacterota bacterium]
MKGQRILVVDDEPEACELMKEVLDSLGYDSIATTSAKEALSLVENDNFDLAMIDIRMPEMDGRSLLKAIKMGHRDLPVMVITGYGSAMAPEEMSALGADGYLAKPFMIEDVRRMLLELLGKPERS